MADIRGVRRLWNADRRGSRAAARGSQGLEESSARSREGRETAISAIAAATRRTASCGGRRGLRTLPKGTRLAARPQPRAAP